LLRLSAPVAMSSNSPEISKLDIAFHKHGAFGSARLPIALLRRVKPGYPLRVMEHHVGLDFCHAQTVQQCNDIGGRTVWTFAGNVSVEE
jgi:hypothetical protein